MHLDLLTPVYRSSKKITISFPVQVPYEIPPSDGILEN